MRENKYRVWDEDTKEMFIPSWSRNIDDKFAFGFNYDGILEASKYIGNGFWKPMTLMQFTSLLDMNGKEIFEGDIVKHDCSFVYGKISYFEGSFVIGEYQSRNCLINYNTPKYLTIIGNIYENPELLQSN